METVLVLNYDYTPLNVTSLRRGFVLVDKGKASNKISEEKGILKYQGLGFIKGINSVACIVELKRN